MNEPFCCDWPLRKSDAYNDAARNANMINAP